MSEKDLNNVENPELEDEYEEYDVITLCTDDGEEVDFIELGVIDYKGHEYSILQPDELPDDMDEDEVLVFRYYLDENDNEQFEIESDEDIIDAVIEEYNRIYEED